MYLYIQYIHSQWSLSIVLRVLVRQCIFKKEFLSVETHDKKFHYTHKSNLYLDCLGDTDTSCNLIDTGLALESRKPRAPGTAVGILQFLSACSGFCSVPCGIFLSCWASHFLVHPSHCWALPQSLHFAFIKSLKTQFPNRIRL